MEIFICVMGFKIKADKEFILSLLCLFWRQVLLLDIRNLANYPGLDLEFLTQPDIGKKK